MNVQARYPTNPEEFLRWNEGREGKREFVDGRVVEMMINVTEKHYFLAARLQMQLAMQLGLIDYIVGGGDHGVRTAGGIRYPDVMVKRPGNPKSLAASDPLLLAEVLSQSTMADDFSRKREEYLSIPSLLHYVILSQGDPALWLWSRGPDGWGDYALFRDPSDKVELPGLGVTLDLGALYAGIA